MISESANLAPMMALQPYLALLAGDTSLDVVGEMSYALLDTPSFALAVKHLQTDAQCAELIAERYMATEHDIDRLLTYPPDSLGFTYAQSMKARGFRAEDLYKDVQIYSDASYVEARLSQTHDIWHIVTGFGVSGIEEIGLQAFHLPQFPYPLAVSLVSSNLMSSLLFAPNDLPDLLSAIQIGWQMGKTAKSFFAQKWEEGWEKPLSQWQAELNIQPIQQWARN
ncbi:MAG: Coq4 family protein [Pseudanabaenaceae cyanobacterium bins.68]|nr:Coq4 family protein [Pseudanabaenaceae cyanobacterium bins.68]